MATAGAPIRVIGLGNAVRGDDAIGLEVARLVGSRSKAVDVALSVPDGTTLLDLWSDVPLCFVVDCTVSGQRPGAIHVFDGLRDHLPDHLFSVFSTHAFSIPRAVLLGRTLGRLPHKLRIYGIEGGNFQCGAGIARTVHRAGRMVADRILTEISVSPPCGNPT